MWRSTRLRLGKICRDGGLRETPAVNCFGSFVGTVVSRSGKKRIGQDAGAEFVPKRASRRTAAEAPRKRPPKRSLNLLPSRNTNPNPKISSAVSTISCLPHPSIANFLAHSSSSGDRSVGLESRLLRFSRIHFAADPGKLGLGKLSIGRRLSIGSAAASADSSTESAVLLGSLESAPAFLFQKARGISEVFNHFGRCYWELSKARLMYHRLGSLV